MQEKPDRRLIVPAASLPSIIYDILTFQTVADLWIFIVEMITTVKYLNSSSNLTIPDPNKHVWSTASITFQASGFSGDTGEDTHGGENHFN